VFVPLYGVEEDSEAMNIYQRELPDHRIIGIDCRELVNGGGAIHSITREIPISKVKDSGEEERPVGRSTSPPIQNEE
jgi:agmatine deiminase